MSDDISKLDELKTDSMRLMELQQQVLNKCKEITGFDNKPVTPIQVIEIVRHAFGIEPKCNETPKA
jgi:hypothetical protein